MMAHSGPSFLAPTSWRAAGKDPPPLGPEPVAFLCPAAGELWKGELVTEEECRAGSWGLVEGETAEQRSHCPPPRSSVALDIYFSQCLLHFSECMHIRKMNQKIDYHSGSWLGIFSPTIMILIPVSHGCSVED